jgi:hypothetical protein
MLIKKLLNKYQQFTLTASTEQSATRRKIFDNEFVRHALKYHTVFAYSTSTDKKKKRDTKCVYNAKRVLCVCLNATAMETQ